MQPPLERSVNATGPLTQTLIGEGQFMAWHGDRIDECLRLDETPRRPGDLTQPERDEHGLAALAGRAQVPQRQVGDQAAGEAEHQLATVGADRCHGSDGLQQAKQVRPLTRGRIGTDGGAGVGHVRIGEPVEAPEGRIATGESLKGLVPSRPRGVRHMTELLEALGDPPPQVRRDGDRTNVQQVHQELLVWRLVGLAGKERLLSVFYTRLRASSCVPWPG